MLLALDIGNSTIAWGASTNEGVLRHGRFPSNATRNQGGLASILTDSLRQAGIAPNAIRAAIISSVVPHLTPLIGTVVERTFQVPPILVTADLDTGLSFARYPDRREIGADRIANAAAAYAKARTAAIVVDFGTATTFSVVDEAGEFLGGAIAPGAALAAEALHARTAQLPRIDLLRPKSVIGSDSVASIQSGLVHGFAGLTEYLITRMRTELGREVFVVATGGLASLLATDCPSIQEVRPLLTLEGLNYLYRRIPPLS